MAARAVTAILVVLLTACSPSVPTVDIQAEPLGDQPTSTEAPTDDATDDPTDEPTDDPTETETAGPRQPTATDRARFVAAFDPPDATGLEHVSVDVDGDGIQELVFAWTHQQRVTRVAIAWWNGSTAYEVAFEADGGEGNSLDTLWVRDVTRDGLTERRDVPVRPPGTGGVRHGLAGDRHPAGRRAAGRGRVSRGQPHLRGGRSRVHDTRRSLRDRGDL
jgi:hypothetical protein